MERWATWMNRTIALGAPGVGLSLLLTGPSLVLSLAMLLVVVVTVAHLVCSADSHRAQHRRTSPGMVSTVVSITRTCACAATICCCVALAGAVHVLVALLVIVAVAASCPAGRDVISRHALRDPGGRPSAYDPRSPSPAADARPAGEPVAGASVMRHFTDGELSRAWARSSLALDRVHDPRRKLGLVIIRQRLLDEGWKRDRYSLERWVAFGARPHDGIRFFDPE